MNKVSFCWENQKLHEKQQHVDIGGISIGMCKKLDIKTTF